MTVIGDEFPFGTTMNTTKPFGACQRSLEMTSIFTLRKDLAIRFLAFVMGQ